MKILALLISTRHVFVKHRCPRRQQSQNMSKISWVLHSDSAPPQGHGMSVKCEEPLNELTVQVWLPFLHSNFNYWTLFVRGTYLRIDGQTHRQTDRRTGKRTDGRTDDPITRCPRRTFQARGIKIHLVIFKIHFEILKMHIF